jgi:very-short-patch-repair endonuclease
MPMGAVSSLGNSRRFNVETSGVSGVVLPTMAGKAWSLEEESTLRELWDIPLTAEEISARLPGRTVTSVRVHAKKLGIRHTSDQFRTVLSKMTSGARNGMYGKVGPRNGVRVTDETKSRLREAAILGHKEGRCKKLFGSDNPRYGKPAHNKGVPFKGSRVLLAEGCRTRWVNTSFEQKRWRLQCLHEGLRRVMLGKPSRIEVIVRSWLEASGLDFRCQVYLGFYTVDFLVGNTVIEVNGDYWHANPEVYPDSEQLNSTQRANLRRDHAKKSWLRNHGYALLTLWERDIHRNPVDCRSLIAKLAGGA